MDSEYYWIENKNCGDVTIGCKNKEFWYFFGSEKSYTEDEIMKDYTIIARVMTNEEIVQLSNYESNNYEEIQCECCKSLLNVEVFCRECYVELADKNLLSPRHNIIIAEKFI